jgi:hypothetical protein
VNYFGSGSRFGFGSESSCNEKETYEILLISVENRQNL